MILAFMILFAVLFVVMAVFFVRLLIAPHEWTSPVLGCPWQPSVFVPHRCGLCGHPYFDHVVRSRS